MECRPARYPPRILKAGALFSPSVGLLPFDPVMGAAFVLPQFFFSFVVGLASAVSGPALNGGGASRWTRRDSRGIR